MERRLRGSDPFGHHPHAAQYLVERAPLAELDAELPVAAESARAGQYQVAEAAEAGQRVTPAAKGVREARNLCQTTSHQRGDRVVPQPQRLDPARGDGDDVLHRASDLHADDVVARIQSQTVRPEILLHGRHCLGAPAGHDDRRGHTPRDLRREARSGEHRHGPRAADLLRYDLGHPEQSAVLDTLRRADDRRIRPQVRRRSPEHLAGAVRRHRRNDVHGAIDGILEDHRGVHGPRQLDAGQIHFVAVAGGHLADESRIPPP